MRGLHFPTLVFLLSIPVGAPTAWAGDSISDDVYVPGAEDAALFREAFQTGGSAKKDGHTPPVAARDLSGDLAERQKLVSQALEAEKKKRKAGNQAPLVGSRGPGATNGSAVPVTNPHGASAPLPASISRGYLPSKPAAAPVEGTWH